MAKVCCGFGHRRINNWKLTDMIYEKICDLIKNEEVYEFMTGNMGDFDAYFSNAVRKAKREYPFIKLVLVEPYFSNKLNRNKEYYDSCFDEIIIPEEILECYHKSAITKRNRWIVDQSDFVISYVRNDKGGAYTAHKYAKRKNKNVISI